jgi:hypothetical protein
VVFEPPSNAAQMEVGEGKESYRVKATFPAHPNFLCQPF